MHPQEQYVDKYLQLYQRIDDPGYLSKSEPFESWYEIPIDLPGRWYLQVTTQLFKENRLAKGRFVGLGKLLSLADVTCPVYLLAGDADDITPREQVFNAARLLGTLKSKIEKGLAPGGHIGLFMSVRALRDYWPTIARWIAVQQPE
jgi:poly(3-hydroxybutyrate) depolymerase